MRRLMLLRHAKTERDSPSGSDWDRSLDARGRREAVEIGRWLQRHLPAPELVLVSTAIRARQSWDLIAPCFPGTAVEGRPELYGADPSELHRIIRATRAASERLMMVAHNPGLHELALALTATGDAADRAALSHNLPTAGIAVIDFQIDDWDDVSFRSGNLEHFASPRSLADGA